MLTDVGDAGGVGDDVELHEAEAVRDRPCLCDTPASGHTHLQVYNIHWKSKNMR
jgi:hypothetical protein